MAGNVQPVSIFRETFNEINYFIIHNNFSEFDRARLKKKAADIKNKVNVSEGFLLQGMISTMENDPASMDTNYRKALEQSGRDPQYLSNYIKSLIYLDRTEALASYVEEAYHKAPEDETVLDAAISASCMLHEIDNFRKYSSEYKSLFDQDHPLNSIPLYFSQRGSSIHSFLKGKSEVVDLYWGRMGSMLDIFERPLSIGLSLFDMYEDEEALMFNIRWYGDIHEGMERLDRFRTWFIDNDYDLIARNCFFDLDIRE